MHSWSRFGSLCIPSLAHNITASHIIHIITRTTLISLYADPYSVYELYVSLTALTDSNPDFTFDMYTAVDHEWESWDGSEREQRNAVGILDGLAAVDTDAEDKIFREQHFPLALLHEHGLRAECQNGQASMHADKVRILDAIGDSAAMLDATIHGRVAVAGLVRAVEAGGELATAFVEAAQRGYLRRLELQMTDRLSRDLFASIGASSSSSSSSSFSSVASLVPASRAGRRSCGCVSLHSFRIAAVSSYGSSAFSTGRTLVSLNLSGSAELTVLDEGPLPHTTLKSIDMSGKILLICTGSRRRGGLHSTPGSQPARL